MFKRLIVASVLAGAAFAAGPESASAANFGPAPVVAEQADGVGVTTVQYGYYGYGPRPYWRRRYYRPYGYYRPRPVYRPYGYGYYAPRPLYRPFY